MGASPNGTYTIADAASCCASITNKLLPVTGIASHTAVPDSFFIPPIDLSNPRALHLHSLSLTPSWSVLGISFHRVSPGAPLRKRGASTAGWIGACHEHDARHPNLIQSDCSSSTQNLFFLNSQFTQQHISDPRPCPASTTSQDPCNSASTCVLPSRGIPTAMASPMPSQPMGGWSNIGQAMPSLNDHDESGVQVRHVGRTYSASRAPPTRRSVFWS